MQGPAWNCLISTSGSRPGASGGGVSGNGSPPKGLANQVLAPAGLSLGLFSSGTMPCNGIDLRCETVHIHRSHCSQERPHRRCCSAHTSMQATCLQLCSQVGISRRDGQALLRGWRQRRAAAAGFDLRQRPAAL